MALPAFTFTFISTSDLTHTLTRCLRAAAAFTVLSDSHASLADPMRRAELDASLAAAPRPSKFGAAPPFHFDAEAPFHFIPAAAASHFNPTAAAASAYPRPAASAALPRRRPYADRPPGTVPADAEPIDAATRQELGLSSGWRVAVKVRAGGKTVGTKAAREKSLRLARLRTSRSAAAVHESPPRAWRRLQWLGPCS